MKSKSYYHCELTEWKCGATGKFEEQQSRGLDLDFAEIKARQKGGLLQSSLVGRDRHDRQSFQRLSCSYAFTGKRAHTNWCLWFFGDRVPVVMLQRAISGPRALGMNLHNVLSRLVTVKETSGQGTFSADLLTCFSLWTFPTTRIIINYPLVH